MYAPVGKWAVRPLSYVEVLLCKDVSETTAKSLTSATQALGRTLERLVPGKCLVVGFLALFCDWNGGVVMLFRGGCGSI